jgi:hypothetical protein
MPQYPPSDFEIDTNTRTVTHKASGRKYSWDRSSEMGDPYCSSNAFLHGETNHRLRSLLEIASAVNEFAHGGPSFDLPWPVVPRHRHSAS